jgi:type IV pilus assembly protein PilW
MTRQHSRGLTLVELLIAVVLSLLLLSAAVSVFLASKETFRLEQDLSVLQENFRYISDRLKKDFSMVGYNGCATPYRDGLSSTTAYVAGAGATEIIAGVEGDAGAPDAVTLTYAMPESGIAVIDGGADGTAPLYVSKELPLYDALVDNFGSDTPVPIVLLVGDCQHADIFMVTGVADVAESPDRRVPAGSIYHQAGVEYGGVSNTSNDLSRVYGRAGDAVATVYSRTDVMYEIDTVGGVTGLYETRNGGDKTLVVDNVTDMQILYGIDSTGNDGNADNYESWSNDFEVKDVTSVKITLKMVVSQDRGADVTRDYTFTIKLRDMGLDV